MHLVCQIQRVYYSTFVSHFLVIIRAVHLIEQLALPSLMWFGQGVASQQKNIIYNFWYIYLCQFEFRFNFLCIEITYLWNICFAHMGMNPLTWHALLMRGILYEIPINKVCVLPSFGKRPLTFMGVHECLSNKQAVTMIFIKLPHFSNVSPPQRKTTITRLITFH